MSQEKEETKNQIVGNFQEGPDCAEEPSWKRPQQT